jgi:hypothetical protein
MKKSLFWSLLGLLLAFTSTVHAQLTKPSLLSKWEYQFNLGMSQRTFKSPDFTAFSQDAKLLAVQTNFVFADKWLISVGMGMQNTAAKNLPAASYGSVSPDQRMQYSEASILAGYNWLKNDNWRLFTAFGVNAGGVDEVKDRNGKGSAMMCGTTGNTTMNIDHDRGRQQMGGFQLGLIGQYVIKVGSEKGIKERKRCCCCQCGQTPTTTATAPPPTQFKQTIIPITFSLMYHFAKGRNNPVNNVVAPTTTTTPTSAALTGDLIDPTAVSGFPAAPSVPIFDVPAIQNFSGVSFSILVGFGEQRRKL